MLSEQSVTLPDPDEIRRDLEYMIAGWEDLPEPAQIELRAFGENRRPQWARFSLDWLDEAAEWAEQMNGHGLNVYAVRNPVRAASTGSATDADIIAAFSLWADCDDGASAGNIRRFDGPRWSASVRTGTTPEQRVHIYWRLAEPCFDLAAWRAMQETIAAHFGSDRTVVNPSRIMRIGGTVAYPDSRKQAKGYVKEVTRFRCTYTDGPRAPVTLDQMRRVFGAAKPASTALQIDVGPQPLDRERTRIQALSGQEWHNAVIRLVASYVSRGLSDDEIHGLTDPLTLSGYTVEQTRREVQTAIDGARRKGWTPEEPPFAAPPHIPPQTSHKLPTEAEDAAPLSWPTLLDDFNELALPRRRWVYGTDYIRGFLSVVASAGGIGKTSQAIVEALAICTGRSLLGAEVREPCRVWVLNLEDPRAEMQMRALAAMKHYGIQPDQIAGRLYLDGEDTAAICLAAESRNGVATNDALLSYMIERVRAENIGVVIIDPFISTHLVNENSNAAIQAVTAMFRKLARETDCAVSLVHHVRKGNGEDAGIDSVRGAGSLIAAARAARVVNRISQKEAEAIGIPATEARSIFRVDDGKSNLAPPVERAVYRRMVGVQLGNGEWVGVATPYELPDEWAGMDVRTTNAILSAITHGPAADGTEHYSGRPQDKERFAGRVLEAWDFGPNVPRKTEAQAKRIVRTWLQTGVLEEVEYYSPTQRKDRKGVVSTGPVGETE